MHFCVSQKGDSNMRIPIVTIMLSTLALGTAAWANDDQASGEVSSDYLSEQSLEGTQAPGTAEETNLATTAEASEVTRGYLDKEVVGIKPQVGVMSYTDQFNNVQGRAAYGFTLEGNLAQAVGLGGTPFYVGPQTGFIFSHFGNPGANFFGSNTGNQVGAGGANVFIIPTDLKLGYNVTERLRLAVHGGGNVLYRSFADAFNTGPSSSQSGSVWRWYPNAGGDVEYAVGQNVAIMARPDVTVTPGNTLFTGTLAMAIALG
jgi:hypothetical protein